MSSDVIISVEKLSKRYQLGEIGKERQVKKLSRI